MARARRVFAAVRGMAAYVGLDLRSLALFRVAFGLEQLIDELIDASDIATFFSDAGVSPRTNLMRWSLYHASGSPGWAYMLWTVHLCALVAMVVGYRTRLATAFALVLRISRKNRNPLLLDSFDGNLATCVLFWALSLPIGAVWSVDAAREPRSHRTMHVLSAATVGLASQMWTLYLTAALCKTDPAWTSSMTALQRLLQMSHGSSSPMSSMLLNHGEWLLQLMTAATRPIEGILPVLLLLPVPLCLQAVVRIPSLLGLLGLQFGIAALMPTLEMIPWLNIALLLAFTPSAVWEWLRLGWHKVNHGTFDYGAVDHNEAIGDHIQASDPVANEVSIDNDDNSRSPEFMPMMHLSNGDTEHPAQRTSLHLVWLRTLLRVASSIGHACWSAIVLWAAVATIWHHLRLANVIQTLPPWGLWDFQPLRILTVFAQDFRVYCTLPIVDFQVFMPATLSGGQQVELVQSRPSSRPMLCVADFCNSVDRHPAPSLTCRST